LGIFTTVVAALTVVGVAWAGSDLRADSDVSTRTAVATGDTTDPTGLGSGGSGKVTSSGEGSTRITLATRSSTSVTSSGGPSTSVTTIVGNGVDSSTSSTIDDEDLELTVSAGGTFTIPGVGTVTIDILEGRLVLDGISAPGWDVEIEEHQDDRIEVGFRMGEAKAEFEAELENGVLQIEVDTD
jgi:hypothetical protein